MKGGLAQSGPSLPHPSPNEVSLRTHQCVLLAQADTNGDGVMSQEELRAYLVTVLEMKVAVADAALSNFSSLSGAASVLCECEEQD